MRESEFVSVKLIHLNDIADEEAGMSQADNWRSFDQSGDRRLLSLRRNSVLNDKAGKERYCDESASKLCLCMMFPSEALSESKLFGLSKGGIPLP